VDLSFVISYVILFFSVQYFRSICTHGAVPLASVSHLFCLHWGLFNEGREHRHAVQHTWDDGQRHCGQLRRETPGPSVRFSRGRHSHILTCAMWLMGKFCVQKGPGAGHWDGERTCVNVYVFVRVFVSIESGACVRSVHTANMAVRSGTDVQAGHKFKSPSNHIENLAHFVSPQSIYRPANSCFLNTPISSQRQQTPANQPCLIRELRLKCQAPSQV